MTTPRMLVPVDFSSHAAHALLRSCDIAARVGARVDVLHVWSPPTERAAGTKLFVDFARSDSATLLRGAVRSARKYARVPIFGRVEIGDPLERIRLASRDYDLLVLGARAGSSSRADGLIGGLLRSVTGVVLVIDDVGRASRMPGLASTHREKSGTIGRKSRLDRSVTRTSR